MEKKLGKPIGTRNRSREVTYGRSIYCKIARDYKFDGKSITYRQIGQMINRDYTSVMHNINVVFNYAMSEPRFVDIYNEVLAIVGDKTNNNTMLLDLQRENELLRQKMYIISKSTDRFTKAIDGLYEDEVEQIFEKIELMAKVMKKQQYA